jgi:hypothetical protein
LNVCSCLLLRFSCGILLGRSKPLKERQSLDLFAQMG